MKFIHTADLHLDSKINSFSSEKAKIRREEIVRSFERLCEYATNNDITAVIISGDMFDTDRISNKTFLRIINAISKAEKTDFLCLNGNHDEKNAFYGKDCLPSNLKFFSDEWTYFKYYNVVITGISFSNKNIATFYDTLSLEKDKINIVSLHGQIAGYNTKDNAELISIPKLKNKNIDYLALGHIHSYLTGEIDLRGRYAYSGCLDARGFDELNEKGFVLIETDENSLKTQFVAFSSREVFETNLKLEKDKNFYGEIDDFMCDIKSKISSKNILKVNVNGEISADYNLDLETLNKRLNEEYFYAKVVDKTTLKISLEDYENDKSIVGEFVRNVLTSDLDKELKDKVLLCGINALNKKEIE